MSHRLHSPLIEIDHYGERLTGCVRVQSLGVDQETLRCRNRSRVAEAYSRMRLAFFLNHPSAHQKGGVCNAKYPKSWIVNIAAQTISISIKARALNLITPAQRHAL